MCGICGRFGLHPEGTSGLIKRMAGALHHRGPNDEGFEQGHGWELGFRRLSILDLSPLGHQPMCSPDGRFWLVFNGEIYNYRELRRDLERDGEQFRSVSDTEVLLRLLARRGAEALSLLNGMFALALVDTHARTFLLARDRLGVKPLYYRVRKGELCFASELKALLAEPDAPRQINPAAVVEYLGLGYLPSETCIFAGYAKLPPGHTLAGSLDAPEQARSAPYWDLTLSDDPSGRPITPNELEEMQDLLLDSVRIRLRSDVPLGIFLSGGVDSGLVAALAAQAAGRPPLALTVGFVEEHADETALARATAQHVGLEHRVVVQRPFGLDDLDRLAWFFDEPFGDPAALPTYALCAAAAQHATFFLSGDGGDEAFGGYRHYIESVRHRTLIGLASMAAWVLRSMARLVPEISLTHYRLLKLGLPDQGAAAVFSRLPRDPATWMAVHPDLRSLAPQADRAVWERWGLSRGESLTARQQRLDYGMFLPDDELVKVDRASMAHSIEVRAPFLDYRLVEWAARLPRGALLNAREGKLPLRALAGRLLPAAVVRGVKRGFDVPLDDWFHQPAGIALARDRLLSSEARRLGFWDPHGVERIIKLHQSPRGRDFGLLLWRLLMLEAWARHYADGTAFHKPPLSGRSALT
jgi:asparagine synthase (glutamine-hydrolysing)